MDSEHRHELEENALAHWLADKIENIKPHLPAIVLGCIVLVAGIIGWSVMQTSAASAKSDRWRDFSIAMEQGSPDLIDLKNAAEANPGTAVADWADVTWADGKLFQASQLYFRNRGQATAAIDEAVEVYERLVSSSERDVAERATYQLGRVYEMQGKLDEAVEQYARVTGAFAEVAKFRAEELESPQVKASYAWITSTETASATATVDTSSLGLADSLTPDNIELPEFNAEEADAALDNLLEGVGEGMDEEEAAEEEAAEAEVTEDEAMVDEAVEEEAAVEETVEEAAEEKAESTEE